MIGIIIGAASFGLPVILCSTSVVLGDDYIKRGDVFAHATILACLGGFIGMLGKEATCLNKGVAAITSIGFVFMVLGYIFPGSKTAPHSTSRITRRSTAAAPTPATQAVTVPTPSGQSAVEIAAAQLEVVLRQSDPNRELIHDVIPNGYYAGGIGEVKIVINDVWYQMGYAERLKMARSLQQNWANVYSPSAPSNAQFGLLGTRGNVLGGSSGEDGRKVGVQ